MSRKTSKLNATEALQQENVIQAVIICDNFNSWFDPITLTRPTALLPLVNTLILDYTLEFLALSGVQEVIIFCSSHKDLIKEHVKKSKWSDRISPMTITVIVSEKCRSFGDAIRDLDAKAVIRGDFILLNGETVSNMQLIPALEHHRQFVKQDKGAVMTLLYKEAGPGHRSRSPENETVLAVDSLTDRVLFHQKLDPACKKIAFQLETFMDRAKVDILYNLQDTHMCICSAAVPPLFSDNFDYQTCDDFVRGLLLNEEILGSTIYWHCLEKAEYAARVTSWHMYQAISHDIIHRWVYPLVPDMSLSANGDPCMYLRHNVYKQKTATLSKGCVLEQDVVIAEGTTVGENTNITCSVIGKDCSIGKNVTITNSYLWDNVVIEDNCCIDFSLVATDAVVKIGSKLSGGCIVAPGVTLEPHKQLKAVRVVSSPVVVKDDFGHEMELQMEKIGEKAFIYQPSVPESDSEDEGKPFQPSGLLISREDKSDESDDDYYTSSSGDMSYQASPVPDDTSLFFNEVVDSLARGYEDKLQCDHLILEINSSRYAYNVSMEEVHYLVVRAILNMSVPSTQQYNLELHKRVIYFLPILKNYIRNNKSQEDCLHAIEDTVSSKSELWDFLPKLLHTLYENDVLEEDAIVEWYNSVDDASPTAKSIRQQVEPLIKWLAEADAESDSS